MFSSDSDFFIQGLLMSSHRGALHLNNLEHLGLRGRLGQVGGEACDADLWNGCFWSGNIPQRYHSSEIRSLG